MIRVKLMDGSRREIRREEALGLFPLEGVLRHPSLYSDGLVVLGGKLVPVMGPLPESTDAAVPAEKRAWLLLFPTHGQVIQGFPEFDDEVSLVRRTPVLVNTDDAPPEKGIESQMDDEEEARLLQEMEDLLKSA